MRGSSAHAKRIERRPPPAARGPPPTLQMASEALRSLSESVASLACIALSRDWVARTASSRDWGRASRFALAGRGRSWSVVVLDALGGKREAPQLGSLAGGLGEDLPPLRGAPLQRCRWLLKRCDRYRRAWAPWLARRRLKTGIARTASSRDWGHTHGVVSRRGRTHARRRLKTGVARTASSHMRNRTSRTVAPRFSGNQREARYGFSSICCTDLTAHPRPASPRPLSAPPPNLATTSQRAPAQPRHDLSARPRPTSPRPRSATVPPSTTGAASLMGERASSSRAERRADKQRPAQRAPWASEHLPLGPSAERVLPPRVGAARRRSPPNACSGCQSAALRVRGGDTGDRATDSVAHAATASGSSPFQARNHLSARFRPAPQRPPSSPPPNLATTSKLAPAQPRNNHGRRRFLRRRPAQRAL